MGVTFGLGVAFGFGVALGAVDGIGVAVGADRVRIGVIDRCSSGHRSGSRAAARLWASAWRAGSGATGLPLVGPNEIRMLSPTKTYGALPSAGGFVGSHLIAARNVAPSLYWVTTSGQLSSAPLIRLMNGKPASPPMALVNERGRPVDPIALATSSAVAGSVRCGSGVMTGVGATVGDGVTAGALAAQAVSVKAIIRAATLWRRTP